MRKFLILLLIANSFSLFSQNSSLNTYTILDSTKFVITYSLDYKIDSLNLDKLRNQKMWLFVGNEISYYVSKDYHTIFEEIEKLTSSAQLQSFSDKFSKNYRLFSQYRIFKNYPENYLTFIETGANGTFKYKEPLNNFNWTLHSDTLIIEGFKTHKASCRYGGRDWIAWFTTEIPINDGPYKFNGLPGLIMEIYDTQKHYVFTYQSIEKPEKARIIKMQVYDYFNTTKPKFFRAREASRNSIANIMKNRAKANKASQDKATRVIASRNNHIELKIDKKKE